MIWKSDKDALNAPEPKGEAISYSSNKLVYEESLLQSHQRF